MSRCCCCQAQKDDCHKCRSAPQAVSCFNQRVNQYPVSDALAPYPDEIIMTILDRILYFFGATNVCHQPEPEQTAMRLGNSPCNPPSSVCGKSSCSSVTCNMGLMSKASTTSSLSKFATAKSMGNSTLCSPKSKGSVCQPACCWSGPRKPHVDFAHPVYDNHQRADDSNTLSERMKVSLSQASIACRRLKSKLSTNLQHLGKKCLCTRLVRSENGCQIYEVYKNSGKETTCCEAPVILFLVTPNGQVMTFESLSTY
ncbi:uncharacterized protein LOC111599360 [Drosophila hydei]|uniref:Uncharacterized protein LOC111599360 n=1 Tax=Drosophila hydei TaxID=7224 RepID=A0A6J1LSE9_DROHY|nr:uncharacterized protein LOC111599360 [Drosophila hydei]